MQDCLTILAATADLSYPLKVELAIARAKKKIRSETGKWIYGTQPTSNNWKIKLCTAYYWYCKVHKIEWTDRPTYHTDSKSIQPPSEEKVKMLIAAAKGQLSLKITISQETGLRPIEVTGTKGLKVKDIHPDQNTITAINTKRCNARPPLKISDELKTRILTHISTKHLTTEEPLFKGTPNKYGENFRRMRNKLAEKTQDQTIKSIRLYDIRHYYVTKQARKIGNSEIVRQLVGHKNLNTTQKYMHLAVSEETELITESTNDKKRSEQLIKENWTYVLTTPDGYMQFKKAK